MTMRHVNPRCLAVQLGCLLLSLLWVAPVAGLEITIQHDAPISTPPSYDPNAAKLTQIIATAAEVYEDAFKDPWPLDLKFSWGELDEGTLALAVTTDVLNGRPKESRIRLNSSVDWFVDPTPEDHSEFRLRRTYAGQLSPENLATSFHGSPPAVLEIGYAGARTQRPGQMDLYSVVLHELGHAFGLSTKILDSTAEDGDVDIPASFLGGNAVGLRVASHDDVAHLASPLSAMSPIIIPDVRRLPSSTDFLAIAAAARWQQVDLPRKEFLGGDSMGGDQWSTPAQWLGNRVPDADDEVTIRHGGNVAVMEDAVAADVRVLDGSSLAVAGGLRVDSLQLGEGQHSLILGENFSGVHAEQAVTLGGELTIKLTSNPDFGQVYSLVTAGALQGEFTQVRGTALGGSAHLVLQTVEGQLLGTVARAGDTNLDGEINFSDFIDLSRNFGDDDAGWAEGDFDGDRQVDFADFLHVVQNFGVSVRGPVAAVPEPASVAMLLCMSCLALLMRRRR